LILIQSTEFTIIMRKLLVADLGPKARVDHVMDRYVQFI
jgi:hypothetical protein